MNRIEHVLLYSFSNESHYDFLTSYNNLLHEFPDVRALLPPLFYDNFETMLLVEGALLDTKHESGENQQIADADRRLDRNMVRVREEVAAGRHLFTFDERMAAERLYNRMKSISYIPKKSYEKKIESVRQLLDDLQGAYSEQVAVLGMEELVTDLATAAAGLEDAVALQAIEKEPSPTQKIKDIRHIMDNDYQQLVELIDEHAMRDMMGTYDKFLARLNTEISYFNSNFFRYEQNDIATAVVEVIAPQPYIKGRPAMPIPTVCYRKREDTSLDMLVATRDFDLTYKNNQKVGNASVVLHGKGRFTGWKEVPFLVKPVR
jgi:hypothetical protein